MISINDHIGKWGERLCIITFSFFLYLRYVYVEIKVIITGIRSNGLKNMRNKNINPIISALRWIIIILILSFFDRSLQCIYLNPSEPIFPVNVVSSINELMQYVLMK